MAEDAAKATKFSAAKTHDLKLKLPLQNPTRKDTR